MNDEQIKKLQRLTKIIDNGAIGIAQELVGIDERVDEVEKVAEDALTIATETQKMEGPPGYTPQKGVDYFDGQNYELSDADKMEIAMFVDVPIVEKVTIVEQPIIQEKETIKETIHETKIVNKEQTAEKMRDKLETLKDDERLDASAIKGIVTDKMLADEIATLQNRTQLLIQIATQRNVTSSSSGTISGYTVETPSGALYDQALGTGGITFTVTATPVYIVADGTTYFNGAGYSIAGLTITMTNPVTQYIRSFHT